MTPQECRRAGESAAHKQCGAAGRRTWSEEDYNLACRTTNWLMAKHGHIPPEFVARTLLVEAEK